MVFKFQCTCGHEQFEIHYDVSIPRTQSVDGIILVCTSPECNGQHYIEIRADIDITPIQSCELEKINFPKYCETCHREIEHDD